MDISDDAEFTLRLLNVTALPPWDKVKHSVVHVPIVLPARLTGLHPLLIDRLTERETGNHKTIEPWFVDTPESPPTAGFWDTVLIEARKRDANLLIVSADYLVERDGRMELPEMLKRYRAMRTIVAYDTIAVAVGTPVTDAYEVLILGGGLEKPNILERAVRRWFPLPARRW
jgi:hypothetical protein